MGVLNVQLLALFGRHLPGAASFLHLPQSRQSGGGHEALDICVAGQQLGLVEGERAVAHDAHVSFEDVEQLRQFVNAVLADETAYAGDTGIVLYLDERILFFLGLLFEEIFFRDDKIVRNQQGSLFFRSAGQVVEADIGLLVRKLFLYLILVEGCLLYTSDAADD